MMFLILPLFALILRISFWRSKKFYMEHLIYSFHLHCFIFLFLTFIMLFQLIIPDSWEMADWLYFAAIVIIFWYFYRSIKVVYHRSTFKTITKLIGMSYSYFFVFVFCLSFILIVMALI